MRTIKTRFSVHICLVVIQIKNSILYIFCEKISFISLSELSATLMIIFLLFFIKMVTLLLGNINLTYLKYFVRVPNEGLRQIYQLVIKH